MSCAANHRLHAPRGSQIRWCSLTGTSQSLSSAHIQLANSRERHGCVTSCVQQDILPSMAAAAAHQIGHLCAQAWSIGRDAALSTTAQSRLRQSVLHCCGPASLKPLHSPGLEPDLALFTSTPSLWCLRRDKAEAPGEEQRRSGIRKFAIELRLPLTRTRMPHIWFSGNSSAESVPSIIDT